jgi:hypothetical protein
MNRLLPILTPTTLQPLGPDAVALSSTPTETQSSQKEIILMALLFGLTENTTSGDVLHLAVWRAQDLCQRLGVNEETFTQVIRQYGEFSEKLRAKNPLAF